MIQVKPNDVLNICMQNMSDANFLARFINDISNVGYANSEFLKLIISEEHRQELISKCLNFDKRYFVEDYLPNCRQDIPYFASNIYKIYNLLDKVKKELDENNLSFAKELQLGNNIAILYSEDSLIPHLMALSKASGNKKLYGIAFKDDELLTNYNFPHLAYKTEKDIIDILGAIYLEDGESAVHTMFNYNDCRAISSALSTTGKYHKSRGLTSPLKTFINEGTLSPQDVNNFMKKRNK